MPSLMAVLSFLGGLVGLLAGGHVVVGSASRIGARFGLTPLVIGLTIVAAGTSAPELAVVAQAVIADDTDLAVGAVIGSNIANVLLVLGLTATFGAIRVTTRVVRFDIPVMIGASVALLVMALDGRLGRLDGALLWAALAVFVVWTLRAAPRADQLSVEVSGAEVDQGERVLLPWVEVLRLGIGIGGLAVAARFVVSGAEQIATSLGVPELIVGLTVVALGTSAPEIATTLIAALQGRREVAVGNAVGSNIFNIFLVLGAPALLAPGGIIIARDALELDLPIMVAAAIACLPIVFWDSRLDRWEGAVFVAYYVAYLTFLVLDATGHRASDPFGLVMVGFVMPLTVLTAAVVIFRQKDSGQVEATLEADDEIQVI